MCFIVNVYVSVLFLNSQPLPSKNHNAPMKRRLLHVVRMYKPKTFLHKLPRWGNIFIHTGRDIVDHKANTQQHCQGMAAFSNGWCIRGNRYPLSYNTTYTILINDTTRETNFKICCNVATYPYGSVIVLQIFKWWWVKHIQLNQRQTHVRKSL